VARQSLNFAWVSTSDPVKLIGTVGNGVTFWGLEKVIFDDKPIEKVNIATHVKPRCNLFVQVVLLDMNKPTSVPVKFTFVPVPFPA
jgi:hypothetical protein